MELVEQVYSLYQALFLRKSLRTRLLGDDSLLSISLGCSKVCGPGELSTAWECVERRLTRNTIWGYTGTGCGHETSAVYDVSVCVCDEWSVCVMSDGVCVSVCDEWRCVCVCDEWRCVMSEGVCDEWRCVWWVKVCVMSEGVCDEWRCVWWVKVCVMSEGVCVCDEWEISSLYFACPIVKLVSGLELKNKIHYLSVFAVSLRVFMRTSSLLYSVFSRELNQWTLLTQFAMYRKCTCVLALPGTHNPLIFFVVCKSIYVCDIIFVYSPQVHTCRTVIFCSARGRPIHARQW